MIDLMFGIHPPEWVKVCREHPMRVLKLIHSFTEACKEKTE